MKRIIFVLFAVSILMFSCESSGELGCYEFTTKTTEITQFKEGPKEEVISIESFDFCGLTDSEAAQDATDMNKEKKEERMIDGELVTVITKITATYKRLT